MKPILDACCGSRMFWFDRTSREGVTFMDTRDESHEQCDGRRLVIHPDIIGDFRKMPFPDNSFRMVVFDPPHLLHAGEKSWLAKKYGKLNRETWRDDLKRGFAECFRVLEEGGFLVFKWNEEQVRLSDVLKLTPRRPLFGHRRGKTHFIVFTKEANEGAHTFSTGELYFMLRRMHALGVQDKDVELDAFVHESRESWKRFQAHLSTAPAAEEEGGAPCRQG